MKIVPIISQNPFEGLFLDLDGVFADFNGKFFDITGKQPHEVHKKEMWKVIGGTRNFFYSLGLCEDAHHLWEYCKQYQPKFLTGLPSQRDGREQKQRWVAEKFGDQWETIVVPKRQKQDFSGPNRVLIDDTRDNIDQWVSKGGHGILHVSVWDTIEQLEQLNKEYQR